MRTILVTLTVPTAESKIKSAPKAKSYRDGARFRTRSLQQLNGSKVGRLWRIPQTLHNERQAQEIFLSAILGRVCDHSHKSKPNHFVRYASINDCFPLLNNPLFAAGLVGTKSLKGKEAGDRAKNTTPMTVSSRLDAYKNQIGRTLLTAKQSRRAVKKHNRGASREDV